MKRTIATLLGALFVVASASSVHAEEMIGEQFQIFHPEVYSVGVLIDDTTQLKKEYATLQSFTGDGPGNTGNVTSVQDCFSYNTKGCESDKFFNYKALLPYCAEASAYNCISSLVATGPDGVEHKADYVEDFPGKTPYSYVGDDEANLPSGGTSFIVSIPSLPHSQGDKYLVLSKMIGNKQGSDKKFYLGEFATSIFAVKMIDGRYTTDHAGTNFRDYKSMGMRVGNTLPEDLNTGKLATCAQLTSTRCAMPYPLSLDVNFELTFRMKIPVAGWLHGRLDNASASISKDSSGNEIIKIGGKPVTVPIVYKAFPKAELPKVITDFYANDPNFEVMGYRFGSPTGEISTVKILGQYSTNEFPAALVWYQALSDRAPYASTVWTVRSIQDGGLGNNCVKDATALNGLVSTNSNMYVAEPPVFNKDEQTLDYKVTSPHFLPDGSVFKGNYNLVINSDFARCLYRFTNAPVSATISILSSDGSQQVATTTLTERNGWIRLSASNFTFSAPVIKVKLTQVASAPTASPSPAPEPTKTAPMKTSITCVKGKTIKKVSAVNPKCPTGYKKKA